MRLINLDNMAKYILSILFVSLFIFGSPISAKAEAEMADGVTDVKLADTRDGNDGSCCL